MASSKNLFLLLGILLVLVFLVSSQVAASHDETSESVEMDGKRGGRGYGYPGKGHGGGGGYPGHGGGKGGGYPGHGGGKGGGYPGKGCRYGCCSGYKYGKGCKRCCATAEEVPDAQFEDDVRN